MLSCMLSTIHVCSFGKYQYLPHFRGAKGSKWGSKWSETAHILKMMTRSCQISSDMLFHVRNTVVVPFFGKSDFLNHYWGYPNGPQGSNEGQKGSKIIKPPKIMIKT